MLSLLGLVAVLASSALAARAITRWLGLHPHHEPLATAIAWGGLLVAWALSAALLPATISMLLDLRLVQLPVIAAVSLAGSLAVHLAVSRSAGCVCPGVEQAWGWLRRRPSRGMLLVALPVATLHVLLVIEASLRPPMACDGLSCHLPLMVRWLHEGRLSMLPEVWHHCCPGDGELWQMLFAATRLESVIELAMIPIGLLLAGIVAGIARELGAAPRVAAVCAVFTLASPMLALQMYGSYVDLFGTTFLLGALYWVLRMMRAGAAMPSRPAAAGLSGLSLGIAVGTKLTLIPWALPVAAAFLLAVSLRSGRRWRESRLVMVAAFAGGMSVGSGYWYLRNGLATGWPLYPVAISIMGRQMGVGQQAGDICTDLASKGWKALAYPWIEWKPSGYPYTLDSGLGPVFAAFAVTGVGYLLVRSLRRIRRGGRLAALTVIGFIGVGAVLYVRVCFSYPRYALVLWAVMLAAAGPGIGLLLRYWPRASQALLAVTVGLSAIMIALWPLKTLAGRLSEGRLSRAAVYGLPEPIEHLPAGSVIVNLASGVANYPLLGGNWTNEVIDPIRARKLGLAPPLAPAALCRHRVGYVFSQRDLAPERLFAMGVCYQEMPADDPGAVVHGRLYRITTGPVLGADLTSDTSTWSPASWAR